MKHRASEVCADDRYHSLMGHEDMELCASTADLDVYFFPRVSPSKEDLESGHADQFITTKLQDSTMSAAVFEPTVPLVERNIQGTNIRKIQQAPPKPDWRRIPYTPLYLRTEKEPWNFQSPRHSKLKSKIVDLGYSWRMSRMEDHRPTNSWFQKVRRLFGSGKRKPRRDC